jgi:hypothetical protein
MRISEHRKNEIIRTTQRTFKDQPEADAEFKKIGLTELRQVDEMLGSRDTNEGFRLRLRNRIRELEEQARDDATKTEKVSDRTEQRNYERRVRIGSLVAAFVVGVAVTLVGQWLWGILSHGT